MSDQNIKRYEEMGWLQMSGMLDRELPQKKKRRRLVYMIWLPVLITGLSSIFFILGRHATKNAINLTKTAVTSQAVTDKYKPDSCNGQFYHHPNERAVALSEPDYKPSYSAKYKQQENRNKVTMDETNELIVHNFDEVRPGSRPHRNGLLRFKKFSDGKISESGHFVSSMNTTNNTVHDRDSVDGLSILDASQERVLPDVVFLPTTEATLRQNKKNEICPAVKFEKNNHNAIRIDWGLRFAVGRQIDINCIKLQAGVYAIKRLNNRWAVEINPQLDISRSHFIMVPDTNDHAFQQLLSSSRLTNTDIFEGKISNTSYTNGDLVLISRLNNANTLYRFAIPFTVKYRISRGLHLTGGLCPHYLIGHDLRTSNIYQEDLVQHSKYYQQRNLNVSLLAGLQYNFKKFGLDLNYSRLILLLNLKKINYSASAPGGVVSWNHDPLHEITVGIRMRM